MTVVEQINGSDVNLQERLIRRVWENEQFAELLRKNPRAAIAEETGVELPPELDIQVHQEDGTTFHMVVPARPRSPQSAPVHLTGPVLFETPRFTHPPGHGLPCTVYEWCKG